MHQLMSARTETAQSDQLLEEIRRAVRERVAATSLRSLARELDTSASGLSKFLDGAHPYTKRFLRLKAWYVRSQREPLLLSEADARVGLTLLTAGMREEARAIAVGKIVDALTDGFGKRPPAWLASLRSGGGEQRAQA